VGDEDEQLETGCHVPLGFLLIEKAADLRLLKSNTRDTAIHGTDYKLMAYKGHMAGTGKATCENRGNDNMEKAARPDTMDHTCAAPRNVQDASCKEVVNHGQRPLDACEPD
jgi:hypothetical protein